MKNILPYITGITAVLLWGAWFPITRYSVISSLGATDTIFLRFTVGSLIAIPLLFRFGFKIQQKYSFWKCATLTFGSGLGYVTTTALGFIYVPASYAMIAPICVIFFSILFGLVVYHTKLTLQIGICLALILFGFFLFAKGIGIIPIAGNLSTLIGVLFFIFAGLFFTAYNIGLKKWSVPAPQAVAISVFYSAVIFLPIYFLFFESNLATANRGELLFQTVYQGVIVFIAVILFSYTSLKMGSSKASLFIILVPISGIIFSVIFLHERINLLTTAAMFIMILGSFIGLLSPRKKKDLKISL